MVRSAVTGSRAACCRRRRAEECLDEESDEEFEELWADVVRRLRRLAFKCRCWAFLGHHLNAIKQQGRLQ